MQQIIADLNGAQKAGQKNSSDQFAKLEVMIAKIMSKMEEKLMPLPSGSHVVSAPNQFDLNNVDSPAPNANRKGVQAELTYFDPHLDLSRGEREVVTVGRHVYYRNVVLFVQCI